MKQYFVSAVFTAFSFWAYAQDVTAILEKDFTIEKINESTPVKDQDMTGTCWSFSTTALVESQLIKNKVGVLDLSEMFTVRNIYIEKAKNYISRQGATQFGEGSLGHDVIRAIARYGAIPEQAYSGLIDGRVEHNHSALATELKGYLDALLKSKPLPADWLQGFENILDRHLGKVPVNFTYNTKIYTAQSFAQAFMNFKESDYINITSFKNQPWYQPFVLDVPDNFSNGAYYNIPLQDMLQLVKTAVKGGYTIMWDADVSNNGFRQESGLALYLEPGQNYDGDRYNTSAAEGKWDEDTRQRLFDNLTTQDDHLMQITGIVRAKNGKEFLTVKNSWGQVGPYKGFIEVSEAYFAINTISLVVPRAALDKALLTKLRLN
jgi:bleomycin hydrolase